MREVPAEQLLRDPVGSATRGACFLVWCTAPDLAGVVSWGAPSIGDLDGLAAALELIRHPAIAPRLDVVLDNRDIAQADGAALLHFGGHVKAQLPYWRTRLRKMAVLVPAGLPGMLVAGLLGSMDSGLDWTTVPGEAEAASFLGRPDTAVAIDDARILATAAAGRSYLLERLRRVLIADLVGASVASAAQALATSPRSLQRELGGLGTTFSRELRQARVAAAEDLLRHSQQKVEAIAAQVGFGTASRLSEILRRDRGATALELRDAERARRDRDRGAD